ncbi:MAG: polysaccharide deacetylase family protein [Pseudomonadota bacterium]
MRISSVLKVCAVLAATGFANFTYVEETEAASCRGGKGLGVSRTVTLNTSGGTRYGASHGGHRNFLKDKEVVLTFDDGPIPATTHKVLLELERHCTKATFFMVGRMAVNHPASVKKVLAKGHTIGIHSYSHRDLGRTNGKNAIQDVDRSIRAINKAAGRKVAPFFRFPYLSENATVNSYLKRRGYGVFAIDVDSLDYRFSSPGSMVNRVMSELHRKGKGIILLHDIQKVTANGLGELLNRLKAGGYKVVHIKGRGGKDVPEPLVVASNTEPKSRLVERPSISVTYGESGELTTTFKRAKSSKKHPEKPKKSAVVKRKQALKKKPKSSKKRKEKKVRLAEASSQNTIQAKQKEALKRRQEAFRKRLDLNRKAFRAAIKKRLITQ